MKQKTIALLLTATLLGSLAACGGTPSASQNEESSQSSVSVEQETPASSASVGTASVTTPGDASAEDSSEASVSTPADSEDEDPASSQPADETPDVSDEPQDAPEDSASSAAGGTETPAVSEPEPVEEPEPEPVQATVPATADAARTFIGQSASSLIAAMGAPLNSSYAPSCLGAGEDGELIYDGFTVFTYRENGVETVEDVL